MAQFCLMPDARNRFTNALRDGTIDPYKLNQMTSEERHAIFGKIVGKDAGHEVNAEFERRMLLKNQQFAYTAWAKRVAGITPDIRRDLMARIGNMDHILNPAEEKQFLSDLAAKKLGVSVTQDEAKKIATLSQGIKDAQAKGLSTPEQALKKGFTPSENDLAYGEVKYDLQKYVSDLKNGSSNFKASDLKTGRGLVQGIAKLPRGIADVSKSIGASLDDSFALRQGMKTLITHPTYWTREFKNSFLNLAKGFKNAEEANRAFKSRLMADPLYDQAVRDKLAIIGHEDVFPTSLPGKIPVAGRAFNASEVAYDAYAENLRLGLYKNELRLAEGKGLDTTGEFGKNVAKMVNSLTGRGGLGKLEPVSGPINVAFYSLRFLKSNIDTLLLHPLGSGVGGTGDLIRGKAGAQAFSYAQKRAAQNLVKVIGGIAAIMGTANALKPGSAQLDPRSSDFGKIKVGDTRFDISGGAGPLVTLAARLATQSSKSSSSGVVTKLNSGQYGSQTEFDTVTNFLSSKASPVGGVAVDVLKGKNPQGQKTTAGGEALKLVEPLNVNNFAELKGDKHSANIVAAMIADTLGISTNTYGKSTTNWSQNPTKELTQFQQKVGAGKFKQANTDYNNKLDAAMQKITNNPTYKSLPSDQKTALLTAAKAKVRAEVFKNYGFKYQKQATDQTAKQNKKSLLQLVK